MAEYAGGIFVIEHYGGSLVDGFLQHFTECLASPATTMPQETVHPP